MLRPRGFFSRRLGRAEIVQREAAYARLSGVSRTLWSRQEKPPEKVVVALPLTWEALDDLV